MGFLKKFGQIVLEATQIVMGLDPIIERLRPDLAGAVQKVESELTLLAGVVVNVEAIGQALGIAGPDKLKAAAPLIAQVVLQSSLMVNHKIDNPDLFKQGCTKIADGMADVLNSLKDSGVQTTNKT